MRTIELWLIVGAVACGGPSEPALHTLVVHTVTLGSDLDPDGYALQLDDQEARPIGLNDSLVLPDLAAGAHTLSLGGLAENCSTTRENPLSISLGAAATTDTTLLVSCLGPNGTLTVRTFTQGGGGNEDGFVVRVDGAGLRAIPRTGSVGVIVPAGTHQILLDDLTDRCVVDGDNPQTVAVGREENVRVTFLVTCT